MLLGRIKELENGPESFNHQQSADKNQLEEVFVLWNQVPDEITLENGRDSKQFTFAMAIDGEKSLVMQEIMDSKCENLHVFTITAIWSSI